MQWSGKLVGGAVGLLVGGPVGAALGALAGHLVDDKLSAGTPPPVPPPRPPPPRRTAADTPGSFHHVEDGDPFDVANSNDAEVPEGISVDNPAEVTEQFFATTFEVMGHIAKADGRVSEQDIRAARAVMQDFSLDSQQTARAIECFTRGKDAQYDLTRAVMHLRRVVAGRPDMLRTFLEIQMRAAIGGSDLRGPARPLLTRVAAMLGVAGLEFAHLEAALRIRYRARGNRGDAADWNRPGSGETRTGREQAPPGDRSAGARPGARPGASRERAGASRERPGADSARGAPGSARMSLQEAYEVLGVSPKAGPAELTKVYRRQLSRNHPDKLKANGLPESMLAHAQQRTQQIIEAWNVIRESRGISS